MLVLAWRMTQQQNFSPLPHSLREPKTVGVFARLWAGRALAAALDKHAEVRRAAAASLEALHRHADAHIVPALAAAAEPEARQALARTLQVLAAPPRMRLRARTRHCPRQRAVGAVRRAGAAGSRPTHASAHTLPGSAGPAAALALPCTPAAAMCDPMPGRPAQACMPAAPSVAQSSSRSMPGGHAAAPAAAPAAASAPAPASAAAAAHSVSAAAPVAATEPVLSAGGAGSHDAAAGARPQGTTGSGERTHSLGAPGAHEHSVTGASAAAAEPRSAASAAAAAARGPGSPAVELTDPGVRAQQGPDTGAAGPPHAPSPAHSESASAPAPRAAPRAGAAADACMLAGGAADRHQSSADSASRASLTSWPLPADAHAPGAAAAHAPSPKAGQGPGVGAEVASPVGVRAGAPLGDISNRGAAPALEGAPAVAAGRAPPATPAVAPAVPQRAPAGAAALEPLLTPPPPPPRAFADGREAAAHAQARPPGLCTMTGLSAGARCPKAHSCESWLAQLACGTERRPGMAA